MLFRVLVLLISLVGISSFRMIGARKSANVRASTMLGATATKKSLAVESFSAENKKDPKSKEPPKEGLDRLFDLLEKADKDPKKSGKPPIYEPGPFPYRALAALPYLVPIADAFDLGKYMFEAYPDSLAAYNTLFGPIAAVYNGVPFLPFAVFFLLSYVCRAPTFSTEIRFHAAQAFMLSIIQFIPSLLFGFLDKAGVPGMAVLYNTGKISHKFLPNIVFRLILIYSKLPLLHIEILYL